ncbi:(2Fe-2S)-binding protein [Yinghuangia seranimata]|uniref:(2Fe-2S)-binding protein n=1 Tax=Yinghuangia seranimata TaxID=408067 RepID=UPI003CCFAFBF
MTDGQVSAQIEGGARSMREIAASCGAGTDCGRCVKTISAMIPRDDTRACDGCTKRCGRICRADRPAAAPIGATACDDAAVVAPTPMIGVPLTVVRTEESAA